MLGTMTTTQPLKKILKHWLKTNKCSRWPFNLCVYCLLYLAFRVLCNVSIWVMFFLFFIVPALEQMKFSFCANSGLFTLMLTPDTTLMSVYCPKLCICWFIRFKVECWVICPPQYMTTSLSYYLLISFSVQWWLWQKTGLFMPVFSLHLSGHWEKSLESDKTCSS